MRIGLWSLVESLPTLIAGLVISAAIDRFVARAALAGVAWLALLPAAQLIAAIATRRLFPRLADVVEPVRDAFLTAVVRGALATASVAPDVAAVARLTNQVQSVRNLLFALLRTMRQVVFTVVAAFAGLALLAPATAVLCGALAVLALALFALLLPGLAARHRAVLLAEEEVARRAGTVFAGARDVIACAAERRAVAHVGQAVDEAVTLTRAMGRATARRGLVVFVGGQLPVVALLATAPWLIDHGYLTLGEVVGAATYLAVVLEPAFRRIVGVVGTWGVQLAVTLQRLGASFAVPEAAVPQTAVPETAVPQAAVPEAAVPQPGGRGGRTAGGYGLVVDGLTFAYGPRAAPVVVDLDLTVPYGGHLAVVGPSGIGKSTIANLLAGLLVPDRGAVLLGGVPIGRLDERDVRRLVGLIPQEAYVFAGTVRENLTYLAAHATDREVVLAARAMGLEPVIDRLGGLHALVGAGGAELSTGERQLVALTRVYLSPARVVILDESTSNLDPAAEARAESAFAGRPGTLIVVAHRISSARRAQRILLLDGDRVHLGTHDELLDASALYADLVGHWSGLVPRP